MKDLFSILLIVLSFIMKFILPQVSSEQSYQLQIDFNMAQKTDKPIYLALYRSEKDFNVQKPFKQYSITPLQRKTIIIQDLSKETDAIVCFQYLNNNDQLDFNTHFTFNYSSINRTIFIRYLHSLS